MIRPPFRIYLFGPLGIVQDEESLTLPNSATARSLLAYICIQCAPAGAGGDFLA